MDTRSKTPADKKKTKNAISSARSRMSRTRKRVVVYRPHLLGVCFRWLGSAIIIAVDFCWKREESERKVDTKTYDMNYCVNLYVDIAV